MRKEVEPRPDSSGTPEASIRGDIHRRRKRKGGGGWGCSQFLQKGAGPSLLHLIPVIALPTDIFRSPITFISYHYHDILSVIYSAPVTKWI